jgi:polysaccharide chain length determinant protein (PEP-CTERM system associated)
MLPGKQLGVPAILDMLRRHVWKLVVPPVAGLFFALLYSAQLPDVFQADVLIAIVAQRVPNSVVQSTVTIKTEERLDALETQVLSRTPLEQMILALDLYRDERARMPLEDVIVKMRSSTHVVLERQRVGSRGFEPPHAFHVQFEYPDPRLAADIAQRLAAAFVDQNARDRGALAAATDQFLDSQLAQARSRLEAQELKLEGFRQRHGKELPTQVQSNMQVINSTQLQIQALVEATARGRDRRLMNERIYNELAVDAAAPVPLPAAPASDRNGPPAPAATAEQQLVDARAILRQLQLRYQPEHPDVQRQLRIIAELEPKVAAEQAAATASGAPLPIVAVSPVEVSRRDRMRDLRAENDSLDRQIAFNEGEEKRLRDVVAEYQRRIEAVPGVESEWSSLTRDYDTQMAAYKELLSKSEESKVAVDLERRQIGEQFRILDSASVPTRPISPNRLSISGIGFAIGIALGLSLALLIELRDTSFRSESDVVESLSVPVLALVPQLATAAERRRHAIAVWLKGAVAMLSLVGAGYVFWTMQLWQFLT